MMSNTNNCDCKSPTESPIMSFDETQEQDFRKKEANSNQDLQIDEGCRVAKEKMSIIYNRVTPDTDPADCHMEQFGQNGCVESKRSDSCNRLPNLPSLDFSNTTYPSYYDNHSNRVCRSGNTSFSVNDLSMDKDVELDVFDAVKPETSVLETPPSCVPNDYETNKRSTSRQLFPWLVCLSVCLSLSLSRSFFLCLCYLVLLKKHDFCFYRLLHYQTTKF